VLFLCTGNSARSIIAEALMTRLGGGRFKAWSAGSFPTGKVNPLTHPILQSLGFHPSEFRSKSWDEFARPDAPQFDFVLTVCDAAAGEVCPIWPGHPMTAHWGIPDPAAVEGADEVRAHAFREAARQLTNRIRLFIDLPFESLDRLSLQSRVKAIGRAVEQPAG
jgi:arsenate reductase